MANLTIQSKLPVPGNSNNKHRDNQGGLCTFNFKMYPLTLIHPGRGHTYKSSSNQKWGNKRREHPEKLSETDNS
jgi:hypothetical protein